MSVIPLHPGERAARATRKRLGMGLTEPVRDLLNLVELELGIPVLIDPFDDDSIAGVLLRHADGGHFIGVNADFPAVRQRFTLAHELGHVELDHQPRVDATADVFGTGRNPQEVEANYFAAEFLAPRPAISAWLEEQDDLTDVEDSSLVARLALTFGIAFSTACYRLERAGAISARAKKRLVAELKESGSTLTRLHTSDRLMDSLETLWQARDYPRAPRQTVALAEMAHSRGLIEEDEYNEFVATVPAADLSEWLG
jgi:Zn-dependent peptidase ImmA (M78 family)